MTESDRDEVIVPTKITREKLRLGLEVLSDRAAEFEGLTCIGFDSKTDSNVPTLVEVRDGDDVRIHKTFEKVDHLTITAESGKDFLLNLATGTGIQFY